MYHTACSISLNLFLVFTTMTVVSGQEGQSTSSIPATGKATAGSSNMIAEVEQAIVDQTNEFRKSNQLDAVQRDEHLTQAAKKFAEFMARTSKYGHRANDMTPAERAEAAGYDYCIVRENIAYRTNSGDVSADSLIEVFVQGWIESPPHRENMLADYVTHTGVAVATTDDVTYYAVQMFGRPKSAAFRLKLTNETEETKTIEFRANDRQDEVELQPGMILTMTRCFPTKVSVAGSEATTKIKSDANLKLTLKGLVKSSD
ncbi:Cysteine-rich secretory protein family protein [Novipirellula galeiformis]|uniref:Cysteine-rich secretory protein family protein n=1 Tax=Novipirellula galeiformis TaxID=2528004 RepID=A0A5C6CMM8_9BACT|nr:CAP domain-containing protein [Novipirellula galeiformis]TWU24827.1 Cysteine-rich secretory protein family protein [Novipirellula galeiformis]